MMMPERSSTTPRLWLDGEHNPVLDETLIALEVAESLESPARCQAHFGNTGSGPGGRIVYLYDDRRILDFGRQIRVLFESNLAATSVFEGRINALETVYSPDSPPEFAILAEDPIAGMHLPHRTRLFNSLTIPELIEIIAGEHGLSVQANLMRDYPPHAVLAQFDQSDLSFLYDCARRSAIDLWVRQGELVISDRGAVEDQVYLSYGKGLLSFHGRADLGEQVTSMTASGWDFQEKQVVGATAGVAAIQVELDNRRSGSRYLLEAYGERRERLTASLPSSGEDAQVLAEAAFRRRARRFVSGAALVDGNPELRVGGRVELAGLGSLFSGAYFIEKVRHLYDRQSGYRTELQVSRPGLEIERGVRKMRTKKKRSAKASGSSKKAAARKL